MTDIDAARRFVALHGRLLDRRRIAGDPMLTREALAAHRNPDGGFAYLEPDLPDAQSQPIAALAALEVLHEIGAPADDPLIAGLGEWLGQVSDPDGGLPFVLPFDTAAVPHAPWMAPPAGPAPSSLHMTAAVAAAAHRAGMAVDAGSGWLDGATAFVWSHMAGRDRGSAYEIKYVIDFLDAVPDRDRAERALDGLARDIGGAAALRVPGGTEGEEVRALSVVPSPAHAGRRLFDPAAIERQLDELAAGQRSDGGWTFGWLDWNPAVTWEWRGRLTVDALLTLHANGRL